MPLPLPLLPLFGPARASLRHRLFGRGRCAPCFPAPGRRGPTRPRGPGVDKTSCWCACDPRSSFVWHGPRPSLGPVPGRALMLPPPVHRRRPPPVRRSDSMGRQPRRCPGRGRGPMLEIVIEMVVKILHTILLSGRGRKENGHIGASGGVVVHRAPGRAGRGGGVVVHRRPGRVERTSERTPPPRGGSSSGVSHQPIRRLRGKPGGTRPLRGCPPLPAMEVEEQLGRNCRTSTRVVLWCRTPPVQIGQQLKRGGHREGWEEIAIVRHIRISGGEIFINVQETTNVRL